MNRLLKDYLAKYNRRVMSTGIIALAIAGGITLLNANFGYNALFGPFNATIGDLENYKASSLFQKYYFIVNGQKILHTGLGWRKVGKRHKHGSKDAKSNSESESDDTSDSDNSADGSDETPEYYMDLLLFDKHLLPIKTMHEEENPVIIGELKEPDTTALKALRGLFRNELIADKIMPLQFEESPIFKASFWSLMLLVAGLCAYGLYKIATVQVLWKELEKHPLGKAMAKAGGFNSMRIELEQDFDNVSPAEAANKVVCGKSWLLVEEAKSPAFIPLRNVVWAYASNSPTSRTFVTTNVYSLILCTTDGVDHNVVMPKKQVDEMVLFIGQRAPWALIGFDGNRALRWNAHKQKLIAEVEQQRDQLLRKG